MNRTENPEEPRSIQNKTTQQAIYACVHLVNEEGKGRSFGLHPVRPYGLWAQSDLFFVFFDVYDQKTYIDCFSI